MSKCCSSQIKPRMNHFGLVLPGLRPAPRLSEPAHRLPTVKLLYCTLHGGRRELPVQQVEGLTMAFIEYFVNSSGFNIVAVEI